MKNTENAASTIADVSDFFGNEFAAPEVTEGEKPEPKADAVDSKEEKPSGKFRREIDLGDGSGKQVFEADSAEALIDELTKAQENATRKIRAQQFELRRKQRAKPERQVATKPIEIGTPKTLTADELFQLGQELQTDPTVAFNKILQAQTGMDANQLVAIGKEFASLQQARLVNEAETSFLQAHQGVDYLPTPDNARAIQKFLQEEQLPYTAANLEFAFQELSESGLLDMPDLEEKDDQTDDKDGQEERIVVPTHTRRKPLSTGVRNSDGNRRQAAEAVDQKTGLTEAEVEEIYKLPLDEARAKIMSKMRSISSGSRR